MSEENKLNALRKKIVVFATVLLFALFLTGIVLTFVNNNLQSRLSGLESQKAQQEQILTEAENEASLRENPNFTEEEKRKNGYGGKDDFIINVEK